MSRIAVAGGTGVVGRMVVELLREGSDVPVVLARGEGVDLVTGAGLDAALRGVSTVIDVSNVTTLSRKRSVAFFAAAGTRLREAEQRAGVEHHVVLSIVGIDRVDSGYYAGKRRQEQLAADGPVPATILRATQFHEFADQMTQRGGPVVAVPKMLTQPIAAREVAEALVALAAGPPQGFVPELAGPQQLDLGDMVRALLRARGSRRRVLTLPAAGAFRPMATGALLPTAGGPRGRQTYDEWLAASFPAAAGSR